jgi:hypothetical protein
MKKSKMSAVALRNLLIVLIFLVLGVAGVGFYFAQGTLVAYSKTVSQSIANSHSSGSSIQSLKQLQDSLAAQQVAAIKATSISITNNSYQTQAVKDLGTYATSAGITVSNYGFPQAVAAAVSTAGPQTSITVTLSSPLSYTGFLTFLHSIETNLPKMQVSSVNMSRIDGASNSVRVDQITVLVYTK